MKRTTATVALLILARLSFGEEGKIQPQPRLKLDPVSLAAVTMPAPVSFERTAVDAGSALMMDRFVVKDQGLLFMLKRRPAVEDPKGKFTVLGGGRFSNTKLGPFEFGLWPHIDIMAADSAFKPAQTTVNFDILRLVK